MDAMNCNGCGGLLVSDGGDYICPHCGMTLSSMCDVLSRDGPRRHKVYHNRLRGPSRRTNKYMYEDECDAWQANAIRIMEDGGG